MSRQKTTTTTVAVVSHWRNVYGLSVKYFVRIQLVSGTCSCWYVMWGLVYCYEHVTRTWRDISECMFAHILHVLINTVANSKVGTVNTSYPKSLEHVHSDTHPHVHTQMHRRLWGRERYLWGNMCRRMSHWSSETNRFVSEGVHMRRCV